MARRSARLQKRSPTPTRSSTSSWETAQSEQSPQHRPERLPSVVEGAEPPSQSAQSAVAATPTKAASSTSLLSSFSARTPTDRMAIEPAGEEMHPAAHHASTKKVVDAQHTNAATPVKSKASNSLLAAVTTRTPNNRTPIKPTGEDMHPALHHATTAKVLDEARWLGFQSMVPHTAPPKPREGTPKGQATPSKLSVPLSAHKISSLVPSPGDFRFRFKSPMSTLSPKSSRIVDDRADKVATTPARALFNTDQFSSPADVHIRKMAVPKGKAGRFSNAHMSEFKKMDSIANHPSAFRANPDRFKLVNTTLKRSPSKAELNNQQEQAAPVSNKLKRTQSKMDMAEPTNPAPLSKLVATPLKRSPSKMDLNQQSSGLPKSQSTVRLVPPTRDGRVQTRDGDVPAKRVKRTETDDAASTRPTASESDDTVALGVTPARRLHSKTALPRPISRLMTPTKSSIARSQSAKALKSTSIASVLPKSPSTLQLFSPTTISETVKEGVREGIRKTSHSLQRVRSILRTPNRKFSDDPEKVAAGTHMSPPVGLNLLKALPNVPVTAPVRKHVNFTNSTLERDSEQDFTKSPSPMKPRAGSEAPSGSVSYPKLQSGVQYPRLPEGDEADLGSPSRRLTFGGATSNTPAKFSFVSDKPITFDAVKSSTIRMVRKSDASSLVEGKKRKLEASVVDETSDKENSAPVENGEGRSPKKARTLPEPPKTPASTSKLPRRTPKHGSAISKSRLAFLATPKKTKA